MRIIAMDMPTANTTITGTNGRPERLVSVTLG
jgi:hypothetical protein